MAATITRYFVNRDADVSGDHEVHATGCRRLPGMRHRIYLGTFASCRAAVREARKFYNAVRACPSCAKASVSPARPQKSDDQLLKSRNSNTTSPTRLP